MRLLVLDIINTAIDAGSDPHQFGQQIIEHLRAILLTQTASAELVEASQEGIARCSTSRRGMIGRGALLHALRAFNESVNDYRGGWQPQLGLELALVESVSGPQQTYIAPVAQPEQSPTKAAAPCRCPNCHR